MMIALRARVKAFAARMEQEVYALAGAIADRRVPLAPRLLAFLIIAYALSPIDLVPDFVPVLGYLDELLLLPLALWVVVQLVPPGLLAEHRARAADPAQLTRLRHAGARIVIALWISLALAGAALWLWRGSADGGVTASRP